MQPWKNKKTGNGCTEKESLNFSLIDSYFLILHIIHDIANYSKLHIS